MAGHSKWANIQHRKGAQDKKRGKIFTKLIREITSAARAGGGDPNSNPRLRLAMEKARGASMPKDNIDRAVKRGTGEAGADTFHEVCYEGYGPGGVAVIVEALTDNRNRTASDVRAVFAKNGGNLAETGAVSFMFDHVGLVEFAPGVTDAETMFEAALDAGADDVVSSEGGHEIYVTQDRLRDAAKALEAKFGEPRKAALVWKPQTTLPLQDMEGEKLLRLIESLEDHDDVQNVYANFEVSDALVAKMSA